MHYKPLQAQDEVRQQERRQQLYPDDAATPGLSCTDGRGGQSDESRDERQQHRTTILGCPVGAPCVDQCRAQGRGVPQQPGDRGPEGKRGIAGAQVTGQRPQERLKVGWRATACQPGTDRNAQGQPGQSQGPDARAQRAIAQGLTGQGQRRCQQQAKHKPWRRRRPAA